MNTYLVDAHSRYMDAWQSVQQCTDTCSWSHLFSGPVRFE